MATVAESLQIAKNNFATELATISANPQPDYNLNGQNVSFAAYSKYLLEQIRDLSVQIAMESGNFEVVTEGVTRQC